MPGLTSGPGLEGSDVARRAMELVRRHLQLDVALISQLDDKRQTCKAVLGAAADFGLRAGGSAPIEATYCNLMVQGRIPRVIPDCADDPRVRDLGTTASAGIGSHLHLPGHRVTQLDLFYLPVLLRAPQHSCFGLQRICSFDGYESDVKDASRG